MQNFQYHIKNSGYSPEILAKKSGILLDRVLALINGTAEPTMSDVRKLSKVLKVSPDFLITNNSEYEEVSILFRQALKDVKDTQKVDKVSYIVGNSMNLLQDYKAVQKLNELPEVENNFSDARLLAGVFRKVFYNEDFFSPLTSLPQILNDKLNCILIIIDLGKGTDGASAIIDTVPFIMISPRFEPRMLFTLAHELAHILAHHDKGNFAILDKDLSVFKRNKFRDEAFANAFASELLLPEEGVASTLKRIRSLLKISGDHVTDVELIILSHIYGVSFEVAAKRCEDLNLIPIGSGISMYEQIKKDFGSPEKRATALNLPERVPIKFPKVSSALINSAIEKVNRGELSIGRASEILSISVSDIVNYNAII